MPYGHGAYGGTPYGGKVSASNTPNQLVSAVSTSTGSFRRNVSKTTAVAGSASMALYRGLTKRRHGSSTSSASVRRTVRHLSASVSSSTAKLVRNIGIHRSSPSAVAGRVFRGLARHRSAASSSTSSLRRRIGKSGAATTASLASSRRSVLLSRKAVSAASGALRRALAHRYTQLLVAAVTSSSGGATALTAKTVAPVDFVMAAWQRLQFDAGVGRHVSDYRGWPAVFAQGLVPSDANRPYVVIGAPILDQRSDTKTDTEVEHWRQFLCFQDANGHWAAFEELVDAVKRAFHRRPLSWRGPNAANGYIAQVVRDTAITTDGTIYGRAVVVRFKWTEEKVGLINAGPTSY